MIRMLSLTKRVLFVSVVLLCGTTLHAQSQKHEVKLRNGSILRGHVVEFDSTSQLKLQTSDGSLWVFDSKEVLEINDAPRIERIPKRIVPPSKGYYNNTNWSVYLGEDGRGTTMNVGFTVVNGYQLNKHLMIGGGFGIESFDPGMMPLFGEVKFMPFHRRTSPYFEGQLGYGMPLENIFDSNNRSNYGGILTGCKLGVRSYVTNHLGINVAIGYRHQQNKYNRNWWWGDEPDTFLYDYMNRFSLTFGLLFN